ncbi:ankyrin repeat domain-containing protein 66 isoform X1 [Corythoichthys intestinalis]|uniref:ankyrin repeat domain-containing protein 66 isoform X1 n=1 Tax=Corythoichthys intestinalis TaxID=161448 RepID=UPI0025A67015|nr:ankyrin repeat domain-containing protein 66 isoform X1 [Corythoichthys intestinalis]XP_061798632.1 ankyrin repeat domain-containing protein 66-like [Nerophis lumbriciformis]
MSELHQAVAAGDYDLVQEILRCKKCDPNQRDVDWGNKTPLHWAAAKGDVETARLLIDHGARSCLRTELGRTAAHFAAEAGSLAVLRLLHSFHAPLDKKDSGGDTPARIAQIYGHHECVTFLKKAEMEEQAYRKKMAEKELLVDDTDQEWEEQSKQRSEGENRVI